MSADELSEEEEISIEEKTAIVRYFINNAPPGHTDKIVEAAKVIGAADVLTEDGVATMLREYDLSNFKPVQVGDGTNVVVCPQTEVAAGEFVQPSTGKVISYDHVTGQVGSVRDATEEEIASSNADKRSAIQKVRLATSSLFVVECARVLVAAGVISCCVLVRDRWFLCRYKR